MRAFLSLMITFGFTAAGIGGAYLLVIYSDPLELNVFDKAFCYTSFWVMSCVVAPYWFTSEWRLFQLGPVQIILGGLAALLLTTMVYAPLADTAMGRVLVLYTIGWQTVLIGGFLGWLAQTVWPGNEYSIHPLDRSCY